MTLQLRPSQYTQTPMGTPEVARRVNIVPALAPPLMTTISLADVSRKISQTVELTMGEPAVPSVRLRPAVYRPKDIFGVSKAGQIIWGDW